MLLTAIAIYSYDENDETFSKTSFAPLSKSNKATFFPDATLFDNLEKNTLSKIVNEAANKIYHYKENHEHHYIKKLTTPNITMAIISRSPLMPVELTHLFINLAYTSDPQNTAKVSLQDIFANPLGYTGKDILLSHIIQSKVDDVKAIARQNIAEVIERGDTLKTLEDKSLILEQQAKQFHKNSKKINSCCRL